MRFGSSGNAELAAGETPVLNFSPKAKTKCPGYVGKWPWLRLGSRGKTARAANEADLRALNSRTSSYMRALNPLIYLRSQVYLRMLGDIFDAGQVRL